MWADGLGNRAVSKLGRNFEGCEREWKWDWMLKEWNEEEEKKWL